jgi:hypothetical protein
MAWWPYAIAHHLNPLFSDLVWQPWGIHLAWTTCVPLLAVLTAPVTLILGPGASFNLAMLAAPVVSAFAAWLLCLRLTGRPMAALIGGFLYGFSAFEMAECLEELNLAYNFAPPLLALLTIERLRGRISGISAVAGATLTLTAQFYISVETFATTVVFAGSAWLLAIVQLPDWRSRLVRFLPEALAALGGAALLATPQLLPMLTGQDVDVPRTWPYLFSAHMGGLFTPSPEIVLSSHALAPMGRGLFGLIPETDATTGVLLVMILGLLARARGADRFIRYALVLLFVILICSLGPKLWWNWSITSVILPWRLMVDLPLLGSALPVRFLAYSSLLVALLCSVWTAEGGRWRLALGVLACLVVLPAPHPIKKLPLASLFMPGKLQTFLGGSPRLLILPGQDEDPSPLWQVENDFGFVHTRGFLGIPPHQSGQFPAIIDLSFGLQPPSFADDLRKLCLATGTSYVIASSNVAPALFKAVEELGWPQRKLDGFTVFSVSGVAPNSIAQPLSPAG